MFFIDFSSDKNIEEFCRKVANHEGVKTRFSSGHFNTDFYRNNAFILLKETKIKVTKERRNKTKSSKKEEQEGNENQEVKSIKQSSGSKDNSTDEND